MREDILGPFVNTLIQKSTEALEKKTLNEHDMTLIQCAVDLACKMIDMDNAIRLHPGP